MFMGVCFHLVHEVISKQQYLSEREMGQFPCWFYVAFTVMAGRGSPSDEAPHHCRPRCCGLLTLRAVCEIIHSVHVSPLSMTRFLSLWCVLMCVSRPSDALL